MELNLELTPRSKILLGILGGVLLIVLVLQVAPLFYRLFSNQGVKAKREQLLQTENLVRAAEVLKPVELEIYKATGLETLAANPHAQGAATLFEGESPETVIRTRIDALVRRAGIQQNYQLLTKPGSAKGSQNLTMQTRENLVRYLYFKQIESEEKELTEIAEGQTAVEAFKGLMEAWLSGTETDDKTEKSDSATAEPKPAIEKPIVEDKHPPAAAATWKFASLPEVLPLSLRVKLAAFLKTMTLQQLRGATDFRGGFFAAQLHRVTTPATSGIFGIGAKPATHDVRLRRDSPLLNFLTGALGEMDTERSPLDISESQAALVTYIEKIQEQQASLVAQLALAPTTYQTRLYTVEMKFKTDLEKLVNLNHLIETSTKWLTVRDLRISADKQAASRPGAMRDKNSERAGGANLNVDIRLIARIF